MSKKRMYRQFLTVAVLSATMTGAAWAATTEVQPGYVASMKSTENTPAVTASAEEKAPVMVEAPKAEAMNVSSVAEAQYVSSVTDAQLAPYVGKTIAALKVEPTTSEEEKANLSTLLKNKIGDKVTADGIKADIAALGNTGVYAEVNPVFMEVPEGVHVTYQLTPNPILHEVAFNGNTVYATDKLVQFLDAPKGQVLNTVAIGQKIQAINEAYSKDGYMLAHVVGVNMNPEGKLTVYISEGVVEDIRIHGNKKTKDYVIKREIIQKVGKPLNRDLARRSVERIHNTGYFEDVNVRLMPGTNPANVILDVDVLEQKTGVVTIGAGYSKSDGAVGIIELGENNFRGTGDKVKVHWEFGGKASNKNYQLSYTRPWLDSKGTSLGFSIFNRQEQYTDYNSNGQSISEYDKRRSGWNTSLGRQLGEYSRAYLNLESRKDEWKIGDSMSGYRYDKDASYGPNNNFDFAGFNGSNGKGYIKNNFGRINSLTYQYVFDSRDSVFDPTRGKRFSYSLQWAGHGLGGDFDFYKATLESRMYKKVGHAQTLALRARLGYASGSVPYSELFTVGGADTLRGYEDDQFKGKKSYSLTLEYRYPIMKRVQGVVFTDMGSAWDAPDVPWYSDTKSFNISVGAGVRLSTPIGPVRLDYGYGKKEGKFHFSFGGQF